MHNAQLIC